MKSKSLSSNSLFESLLSLGGKRKKDSIEFIRSDLLIKHKESGVKYTVVNVQILNDEEGKGKPSVMAYRYYGPDNDKKYFIKILPKNFKNYEPV